MAEVGIPTSKSRGNNITQLLDQFNAILEGLEDECRTKRILMAAGAVEDDVVYSLWITLAMAEANINTIRKTPDFHDSYARYRGLSYAFHCTNDINAATDKVINLPVNHLFVTNDPVDFVIREGSLPGGLSEDTNYFVRTVDAANGTLTLTTALDGATDINLTNGTGTAEMILNIKPNLASLRTAIDVALDEIELNLAIRAATYDRANLDLTYSTRSTVDTTTLQSDLQDIENLIDVA